MFWVIRWTDLQTSEDHSIVVEAETRAGAETVAAKWGIPLVYLGPAEDSDVAAARQAKLLWRYTRTPRYTCFGQAVGTSHVACLLLCGVWTGLVNLQSSGILAACRGLEF